MKNVKLLLLAGVLLTTGLQVQAHDRRVVPAPLEAREDGVLREGREADEVSGSLPARGLKPARDSAGRTTPIQAWTDGDTSPASQGTGELTVSGFPGGSPSGRSTGTVSSRFSKSPSKSPTVAQDTSLHPVRLQPKFAFLKSARTKEIEAAEAAQRMAEIVVRSRRPLTPSSPVSTPLRSALKSSPVGDRPRSSGSTGSPVKSHTFDRSLVVKLRVPGLPCSSPVDEEVVSLDEADRAQAVARIVGGGLRWEDMELLFGSGEVSQEQLADYAEGALERLNGRKEIPATPRKADLDRTVSDELKEAQRAIEAKIARRFEQLKKRAKFNAHEEDIEDQIAELKAQLRGCPSIEKLQEIMARLDLLVGLREEESEDEEESGALLTVFEASDTEA